MGAQRGARTRVAPRNAAVRVKWRIHGSATWISDDVVGVTCKLITIKGLELACVQHAPCNKGGLLPWHVTSDELISMSGSSSV